MSLYGRIPGFTANSVARCLTIARSHSLAGKSVNALALTKHAVDQCQESAQFFAENSATSPDASPRSMDIRKSDVQFLQNILAGELQRCRALVEIDNLRAKAGSAGTKSIVPLVERLYEFPAEGADLENLVTYPPKIEPIPVKPLFFDVAWNYIDYPGQTAATAPRAADATPAAGQSNQQQKRGWFGFGRG